MTQKSPHFLSKPNIQVDKQVEETWEAKRVLWDALSSSIELNACSGESETRPMYPQNQWKCPIPIILVSCLPGNALERRSPPPPLKKWSQCPKPLHLRPADQHRGIQSADQSYPTQPSEKPTLFPNHRIHSPHPTDQRS